MKTLSLFVQDINLKALYEEAILSHNQAVETNAYADSGFDLFLPEEYQLQSGVSKIDYEVKAAMYEDEVPCAFCVYSRSSIYKTPLRMTNCVGIIDSGYRGNLCSMFDVSSEVGLKRGQRLVQICSPDLKPFKVNLVSVVEELGQTVRGELGFGSTGV
jgi:dUTP pyrophosphatase